MELVITVTIPRQTQTEITFYASHHRIASFSMTIPEIVDSRTLSSSMVFLAFSEHSMTQQSTSVSWYTSLS